MSFWENLKSFLTTWFVPLHHGSSSCIILKTWAVFQETYWSCLCRLIIPSSVLGRKKQLEA